MQFLNAIDLAKNELRNARVQNLASAPATPVAGQIYFDTTTSVFYYYDGTGWVGAGAVSYAGDATITTIQPDATAAGGTSATAARGDHRHAIVAAAAGASAVGDAAAEGTATSFARSDHVHAREGFGAVTAETTFGGAASNGVATSVARSDHAHGTPAHGATQHSTISLSALAAPTADLAIGGFKLTGLADPTNGQDAATKAYVDAAAQGLDVKESVRAATTASIANLSNASVTHDGVTLVQGDRLLVKNGASPDGVAAVSDVHNGIYVVGTVTTGTAPLTRASDFDTSAEVSAGAFTFVEEGTSQADSGWVLTTNDPVTLGTSALTFAQFSGAGQIDAGAGLTKTGNTLDVGAGGGIIVNPDNVAVSFADAAPGAVSPTGGAVGVGTQAAREDHNHNATAGVPVGLAPDGANAEGTANALARSDHVHATPAAAPTGTLSPGSANAEGASTSFARADHTHAIDAAIPRKVSAAVGDGTATAVAVTHNLGTQDVQVTVYQSGTPFAEVLCDIEHTDVNTVTLRFATAPAAGAYRAVVVG